MLFRSLGAAADVNLAVAAARRAFLGFSQTSVDERIALMEKLLQIYIDRYDEMAVAISIEMGAPISFATAAQADCGRGHINAALEALKQFEFERQVGNTRIVKEAIGVCGFITPWNWPINQISCKVAPALATGCTMVLKPSEIAPISGYLFTEMMDQAGFPAGVYNMVNGDGPNVGSVIASHPEVDMVSFTGSTRAGILVAKAAADTVKRVTQELGGKSPNIIFEDADLEKAVTAGVTHMMGNTGQSCNAPSRMLVQSSVYGKALAIAKQAAANVAVDQPTKEGWHLGPLSSRVQFDKVQGLIHTGIEEGATLLTGGTTLSPESAPNGYFVAPTVFIDCNDDMTIVKEEIFGPVMSVLVFDDEDDVIARANATHLGLAAGVFTSDIKRAHRVIHKLQAGICWINAYGNSPAEMPVGGYKQSGIGRENGIQTLDQYTQTKSIYVGMADIESPF